MAACGVGNGGAAGGGVAVITGKDNALGAMNRKRELPSEDPQSRISQMASGSESRLIVGRASLASSFADIAIIFILGLAVLFLYLFGQPYERGFFCDDDSIRFSYKEDTVSSAVLIACSVFIPSCVVLVCEVVALKRQSMAGKSRRIAVGRCTIPVYLIRIISALGLFLFGLGTQQVIVDAAVFTAVFLWRRFYWRPRARLQLAFAMLLALMLAWLTALSRISDHKHHWSDVLSGSLIGGGVAALTVSAVIKRVPTKTEENESESTYVFGDRPPHAVIVEDTPPATS